jgi:hypothetical protein
MTELPDLTEETPEQRETRVLTARVKEFGRNYTLATSDRERSRTDKAAYDFMDSFLFDNKNRDGYKELYWKESGR